MATTASAELTVNADLTATPTAPKLLGLTHNIFRAILKGTADALVDALVRFNVKGKIDRDVSYTGWRHVEVTERKTSVDFARFLRTLSDEHYVQASGLSSCATT